MKEKTRLTAPLAMSNSMTGISISLLFENFPDFVEGKVDSCFSKHLQSMIGENRQLVTNEPVEFEK